MQDHPYEHIVYLFQGGGALGAFQVGICEALLQDPRCQPDWIVGTSIGAVNAAIIAGNVPEERQKRLNAFWNLVATADFMQESFSQPWIIMMKNWMASQKAVLLGQAGFFSPRWHWHLWGAKPADQLSFYNTHALRETLERLVDFRLINQKKVRLTVSAVNVAGGRLVHFDNFEQEITPEHIMASGALPPGFPAIGIHGHYYWDGGLNSNTPLQVIFDEKAKEKILCFMVDLFAIRAECPTTLSQVLKRKKDLQFSSHFKDILRHFCEIHALRHRVDQLLKELGRNAEEEALLPGRPSLLNMVRFHFRDSKTDLWTKDFEFSQSSIRARRLQGFEVAQKALADPKWLFTLPTQSGIVVHNF